MASKKSRFKRYYPWIETYSQLHCFPAYQCARIKALINDWITLRWDVMQEELQFHGYTLLPEFLCIAICRTLRKQKQDELLHQWFPKTYALTGIPEPFEVIKLIPWNPVKQE